MPLVELIDTSVIDFVADSKEIAIAALFEEDVAVAFVSNDDNIVEKLREKGLSMHAKDARLLFGNGNAKEALVAGVYKRGQFIERSLTDRMS